MNIQAVAEQHSETLEDIAKFFEGLRFGRFEWHKRSKRGFNKHGRPMRSTPVTLSWPVKTETIQ